MNKIHRLSRLARSALRAAVPLLLCFALCACGAQAETAAAEYAVTLPGSGGSGYYWSCIVSDESVVTCSGESRAGDDSAFGSPTETHYAFRAAGPGSTKALFTYARSWDATICYTAVCDFTVGADGALAGRLSPQSAVITLDGAAYDILIEDDTVVQRSSSEAPAIAFQGRRDGSTGVVFTPSGQTGTARRFLFTVDQALNLSVAESDEVTGSEAEYETPEALEADLGYEIPLPQAITNPLYSRLDQLFCITFSWSDADITYIGGMLDDAQFFSGDAKAITVNGRSVGVTSYADGSRLAGWTGERFTGYVCSAQSLTYEQLLSLLSELVA